MNARVEIPEPSRDQDIEHFKKFMKSRENKDFYILDENKNVIPATLFEWGEYLQNTHEERIVKKENIDDYVISTVFIGLNHSYSGIYPHIFETMIFKNGESIYCDRYSTWQEAEKGHLKATEGVRWLQG